MLTFHHDVDTKKLSQKRAKSENKWSIKKCLFYYIFVFIIVTATVADYNNIQNYNEKIIFLKYNLRKRTKIKLEKKILHSNKKVQKTKLEMQILSANNRSTTFLKYGIVSNERLEDIVILDVEQFYSTSLRLDKLN